MSDEEAEKSGSSECGDVERSTTNDRTPHETRVQTVTCRQSDELEIPADPILLSLNNW